MTFLKKANLGATPAAAPKLGKKLGGIKPKEIDVDPETTEDTKEEVKESKPTSALGKKTLGTKKLGGIGKKTLSKKPESEPKEEVKEETTEELKFEKAEAPKKTLGTKKLGKKTLSVKEEVSEPKEEIKEETKEAEPVVEEKTEETVVEVKEEIKEKTTPKKSAKSRKRKSEAEAKETEIVNSLEVDETKRVTLPEMDTVMRPIVAPTTELWEQEKKDVLEALDDIKVEQDMEMSQVKTCLANLDDLNFEILPKLHDAETMYDGTKQNYDTVKAVAISKGSATNAEGRKAEGIIACQNFVTPTGAVVDLHQYMLLIEERYKFYQKVADGISFKKYSLVNYNNALKVESKN